MKRLIITAAVAATATGALAQGQFTFGNKNSTTTPPINARVSILFCGQPEPYYPEGTAYWAQAYVKLENASADSFAPVGAAVHFRTGANAGYIVPVVVTTPYAGGTRLDVQMRAWDAAGGNTFEGAMAAGALGGWSNPVGLTVAVAPIVPPDMIGLQPFGIFCIPEPSPLALGVLGAAVLLMRRRS